MRKVAITVLLGLVVLSASLEIATASNAKSDKRDTNVQSKNPNQLSTSNWILPTAPKNTTDAIEIEAGSSVPLKFQIFNPSPSAVEIKSGSVSISTIVVSPCPSNVKTPTPTASKLTGAKPGNSQTWIPKYQGKYWNAIWKSEKDARGCFKIRAVHSPSNLSVDSPTFVIYPKSN